jgi:hypothetical protein
MTGVVNYNVKCRLDMWVFDLAGPISIETMNGKKYVLLIIDVYTRKIFVVLLAAKNDATGELIKIIIREQNQTRLILKRCHSDNDLVFVNNTLDDFF